jgi:hypothetical protein
MRHVTAQRSLLESMDAELAGAFQPGNRLIASPDVAAAKFRRGIIMSRTRLELANGAVVKLLWMRLRPTRINPSSNHVEAALQHAFGPRLELG